MTFEYIRLSGILGFLVAIALWYLVSFLHIFPEFLIPLPHTVFGTLYELLIAGDILVDSGYTLYRTMISYVIASAIGIPTGILMGYSRRFYHIFQPAVDFFRSIPAVALFPLFLLLFGLGDASKVAVAAFAASLLIMINGMYGVSNANKSRIIFAKTLRATELQIFTKIVFFEALPYVFVGLRQSLSIVLIVVIVTEMFFGSTSGLGYRIFNYHLLYKIPEMYAHIVMAGIIGYILNLIFVRCEKRIVHWTGR